MEPAHQRGEVHAAGRPVQLHLQRVNSHIEIVVSDTGQGIAPGVLPHDLRAVSPGRQLEHAPHGGLGLGLALVKHLVELHGGSVVAQSAGEGRGATFVVQLPLPIADIPAARFRAFIRPLRRSSRCRPASASRAPVLLVDDDRRRPRAGDGDSPGLRSDRADVLSAPEALNVLRAWRPDVLVSDIEMPGEDGYALIRKVRALRLIRGGPRRPLSR